MNAPHPAPLTADELTSPAMHFRPGFRWWWQSPVPAEELVRELRAMAEAGFGEVEVGFTPEFWADEQQRKALGAVLAEASILGVGVAVTLGAAWPLQTPNTARGTEHAAQELQYGVLYLDEADSAVSAAVPFPFDDLENARGATLVAATAARVLEQGPGPTFKTVFEHAGARQGIVAAERSTILDGDSLVDLTDLVVDGTVSIAPGTGRWALFGFWTRDCEQGVTSFIDRSAAIAATEYLDEHQFGKTNIALLNAAGTELFEDSLELNADSLFWSPDFLERFQQRHGYSLVPYLPLVFAHGTTRYWVPNEEPVPDFDLGDRAGARVRSDYLRLLTDLYVSDHLVVLQEWSQQHGLLHKSQAAYGQCLEPVRSFRDLVRVGGRAEGESLNSGDRAPLSIDNPTWRFALDWQRSVVGGSHQGGATRISTELGAQFQAAYAYTLGDLKAILDKEWAVGLTKPFVHGYATQAEDAPWPSQPRFWDFIADSWNDLHFPEWANWRPLTDYWARGTAVLETGTPRTDIAIYRDGFLTSAARGVINLADDATAPAMLAETSSLEAAGFSVQFIEPVGLSEDGTVGDDGSLYPHGPAYRGVVLEADAVTPEAAEALARAAALGLRVVIVGEGPSGDVGFSIKESGDERVRRAMELVKASANSRTVATAADAADAFAALGLVPRAAVTGGTVLTQWRETQNGGYLLVYNPSNSPLTVQMSCESVGGVSELDLWAGARAPISWRSALGRDEFELELAAQGLRVLELGTVFNGDVEPRTWTELPVTWGELVVTTEEAGGPREVRIAEQGPADWRDVAGLEHVSGVGVYRVTVPATTADTARIEFEAVSGSVTPIVNGTRLTPVYGSGVVDLGPALSATTETTIELEVRTALRNAVAGGGNHVTVRTTAPHGLTGLVRVLAGR